MGVEKVESDLVDKTFSFSKDFVNELSKEAEETGRTEEEVLHNRLEDGFYVLTTEESVVTLKFVDGKSAMERLDEVSEDGLESEKNLKIYRELREGFPPITAGIDYLKAFVSGSGFNVGIDDPSDKHQIEARDYINEFNRTVFMDEVTIGLDAINDLMLEDAYTIGCSAMEIVYQKFKKPGNFIFNDWVTVEHYTDDEGKDIPIITPKPFTDENWKDLGGIVQLKLIPDSYTRLTPKRDPKTYQILYYAVDEKETLEWNKKTTNKQKEITRLLPWQVFWFSPNRTDIRLKGPSIIKPVASTALLLKGILRSLGISIDRWADKKYFFILGSDKTGRSWAKPHVRNFINNVKKMTAQGSTATGIPVPAGFDIKEIGGEVYDGGQIIDKLLSMITAGMKYPRTFIEQGKTQEGDKAWLAWIVMYGRYQTQLKRAVEHQLWRRHLYSKFGGTTVEVVKPGPKAKDKESREVYVPSMQWKSEGRWHRETKINILKDILNTGNPVTPTLKLFVEEDMAITMGYSEISLDDERTLLEQDVKLKKLDGKIEMLKKQMELEVMEKAYKDQTHLSEDFIPKLQFLSTPMEEEPEEPSDEGDDGKRKPPDPEKRLKGGLNIRKQEEGSKKGVAKPMGSSRGQSSEETVMTPYIPTIPIDLRINVVSEPQKVEITTKPQEILIKSEPQNIDIKINNDELLMRQAESNIKIQNQFMRMIEEKVAGIDDITKQNKIISDEIKSTGKEMKDSLKKKEPTEEEKVSLELKKKKIEFMKEWMKENK